MNRTDVVQLFSVVDAGPARWEVRHDVTDELAGILQRTPSGFLLTNEVGQRIGSFDTIPSALEGLYALL
jgi:hypothetical protein